MKELAQFIIKQLKPFKKTVIFCALISIIAALLDVASPILLGRGFDYAGASKPFIWYGGAVFGWFAARALADRARSFIGFRADGISQNVAVNFVTKTFGDLLLMPLAYHYGRKSQKTSEILSRLRWILANVISGALFDLAPAVLAVLGIVAYLFFLEPRVALALGVSAAALVAYTYRTIPESIALHERWDDANGELSSYGWDALRNILVVKSTTNEETAKKEVERRQQTWKTANDELDRFNYSINNWQNIIIGLGSAAAIAIAVFEFASKRLTFGELTAITAYTFAIFGYVRYTRWQFRALLDLKSAYNELKKAIDESPEDYAGGREAAIRGDVEFRGIRFRYREDLPMLENVSFAVQGGQNVAIVGESGEGKTTLVDLLGLYHLPQAGSILVDGRDIKEINLRSLRSQMAYVPQDLTLFHDTIGANIRYGRPDAADYEVAEAARLAHLEEFIEGLPQKYATVVGERGLKLSGGERQRAALARAFLRNPRVLILDEPTAHLDSKTEQSIHESLGKLMAGRTTFIIAHRLRTVKDADVILVLKDGRIAETGTHEELVKRPDGVYAALLRAQGGFISPDEAHLGQASSD